MVIHVQKNNGEPTESGIRSSGLAEENAWNPQEGGIMTKHWKQIMIMWIAVAVAIWVASGWSQQTQTPPTPGNTVTIEGAITTTPTVPPQGPPSFLVKTSEGKEYLVMYGPFFAWSSEGFNPKAGDKVSVSGTIWGEMGGKPMIHSSTITLAGKTFSAPSGPGMWGRGPGMWGRGPGMMMGGRGPGGPMMGYSAPGYGCPMWNRW